MSIKKTPHEDMLSIKFSVIIQCTNGDKYTNIQSDNNTKDGQIQSDEASVIEEDDNVEVNDADMSLHKREMCSEYLRSEV